MLVWQAEAHLELSQSEHRSGNSSHAVLCRDASLQDGSCLGYCLFIWAKSQFGGGTQFSETGDFTQGLPVASVVSQGKGEAFALGTATEVAHQLN